MGILSGNPKDEPLHYGEVYDIWQFSMAAKGCISGYTAMGYHAGENPANQQKISRLQPQSAQ